MEKGELDDNGDLKKEINERLLTARQVSRFILYSFAKLILRAFHVWNFARQQGYQQWRKDRQGFCSHGASILV